MTCIISITITSYIRVACHCVYLPLYRECTRLVITLKFNEKKKLLGVQQLSISIKHFRKSSLRSMWLWKKYVSCYPTKFEFDNSQIAYMYMYVHVHVFPFTDHSSCMDTAPGFQRYLKNATTS